VSGLVAPGFEEVRAEFERNFAERGEIGAAVAAYWRGEKVVDLWGGRRTPEGDAPWNEDTMVVVMSSTKGLSAMALAVANARGWLDYDAPVASHWPEFAQSGKAAITVRQLLGHETGLVLLDEKLTLEKLRDLDGMTRLLARQKPARRRDKVCGARMPQRGDTVPLRQLVSPTNTLTPRHLSVWYIGCT
jgi:CubicO group peptidase (beta-lactamase class C family)